jgi:hypothetical protein
MAFFVPLTIIYVGSYIAPRARVWTARVLAGAEGLLIVGSLFFIASSESLEYDYEGAGWIELAAVLLLNVGGVVVGIRAAAEIDG